MSQQHLGRISLPMLRSAAWALRARQRARRAVWNGGIAIPVPLPPAPPVPIEATGAVIGVLGRTRATCLVRSLVLQRWYADHGEPVDVIIGVTEPSGGFRAHAWLDRADEDGPGFAELHRLPPPTTGDGDDAPALPSSRR